ncbi:hypothetical protein BJ165DRAFT_1533125 [Panaeolus papilionaceus]|nr:hypothetical protein BJ165DRAFT_1533125 [Panaeolus papilionaceus]
MPPATKHLTQESLFGHLNQRSGDPKKKPRHDFKTVVTAGLGENFDPAKRKAASKPIPPDMAKVDANNHLSAESVTDVVRKIQKDINQLNLKDLKEDTQLGIAIYTHPTEPKRLDWKLVMSGLDPAFANHAVYVQDVDFVTDAKESHLIIKYDVVDLITADPNFLAVVQQRDLHQHRLNKVIKTLMEGGDDIQKKSGFSGTKDELETKRLIIFNSLVKLQQCLRCMHTLEPGALGPRARIREFLGLHP